MNKKNKSYAGIINLLRMCTSLLAVVSFWATAQGMAEYVFSQKWQAYAASLAIQGVLLGLNFYLPSFWKRSDRGIHIGLVLLTSVVLFCSSWFSYVYIVGQVYGKSWDVESQLFVQSVYREKLYNAEEYANIYSSTLSDNLSEQIINLYARAGQLEAQQIDPTDAIDWEDERATFTNEGFAARGAMVTAINAMESAVSASASEAERNEATEIIVGMSNSIEATIENLNVQIASAETNLASANSNYLQVQRSLNNATNEGDRNSLISAVQSAQQNVNKCQTRLQQLQSDISDYQDALLRIKFYEVNLGLVSEGSAYLIATSLKTIQKELFKKEPDIDVLESNATSIFDLLQSTVDASFNEGVEYQALLLDMNNFIGDLRNYRIINDIADKLQLLIDEISSSDSVLTENKGWRATWSGKLDNLKAHIASMPVYINGDENVDLRLVDYDRARESKELDDAIRLYISEHNAAQQGLIYLFSPYWELAVFSIVLAFFLDIAAFITGILIYIVENEAEKKFSNNECDGKTENKDAYANRKGRKEKVDGDEEIVSFCTSALNRYIYLNGDYLCMEGKIMYRAIEAGQEIEVEIDQDALKAGLYIEKDGKVKLVIDEQELKMVSSPQDGVYKMSKLAYEDHAISIANGAENEYEYLASIYCDLPVCIFDKNCLERIITPEDLPKDRVWDMIIISLNEKGTEIIAIYLII